MVLSDSEKSDAMRHMIKKIFVQAGETADMTTADIKAAISSIDDMMSGLAGALNDANSVEQNFKDNLPEPFKSTATNAQKALVLAYWAMKRGGII